MTIILSLAQTDTHEQNKATRKSFTDALPEKLGEMSVKLTIILLTTAPFMKLARQRKVTVSVAEHPEYAVAMHMTAGMNRAGERKQKGQMD